MAKKDSQQASQGAQGTPGEGRFYRPPSVAPEDDTAPEVVGPEGRFYVPSADDKAGESVAENPVEQAGLMAGEPPSKAEVKTAKAEQKAAEKDQASGSTAPVPSVETTADPAAQTGQVDPVAAAGELAQDPPTRDEVKAAKAEQKAAGQPADPKPIAKKTSTRKSTSSNK